MGISNEESAAQPALPKSTRTRARTKTEHAPPGVVRKRVNTIRDMMAKGEWHKDHSKAMLATKWGVAPKTIQVYSAEASRLTKALIDKDVVGPKLAHYLTRGLERADRRGETDRLAKVAETYGRIVGLGTETVQVDVKVQAQIQQVVPPMTAWVVEDLPAAIRAGLAEDLGLEGDLLERAVAVLAARLTGARPLLEARIVGVMGQADITKGG